MGSAELEPAPPPCAASCLTAMARFFVPPLPPLPPRSVATARSAAGGAMIVRISGQPHSRASGVVSRPTASSTSAAHSWSGSKCPSKIACSSKLGETKPWPTNSPLVLCQVSVGASSRPAPRDLYHLASAPRDLPGFSSSPSRSASMSSEEPSRVKLSSTDPRSLSWSSSSPRCAAALPPALAVQCATLAALSCRAFAEVMLSHAGAPWAKRSTSPSSAGVLLRVAARLCDASVVGAAARLRAALEPAGFGGVGITCTQALSGPRLLRGDRFRAKVAQPLFTPSTVSTPTRCTMWGSFVCVG